MRELIGVRLLLKDSKASDIRFECVSCSVISAMYRFEDCCGVTAHIEADFARIPFFSVFEVDKGNIVLSFRLRLA